MLERLLKEQREAFEEELTSLRSHREGTVTARRTFDEELAAQRELTAAAQAACREAERAGHKASAMSHLAQQREASLEQVRGNMYTCHPLPTQLPEGALVG